jgi:hypothetical protein
MRDESPGAIEEELRTSIAAAVGIARQLGWTGGGRLEGLADRLDDDREIVAALGGFNRGKSSFMNALLGTDVLPVGVLPLTNLATELRWGAELEALVGFADGSSWTIDLKELASFVTQVGNPANHRGVERVLVRLPAEILSRGERGAALRRFEDDLGAIADVLSRMGTRVVP